MDVQIFHMRLDVENFIFLWGVSSGGVVVVGTWARDGPVVAQAAGSTRVVIGMGAEKDRRGHRRK